MQLVLKREPPISRVETDVGSECIPAAPVIVITILVPAVIILVVIRIVVSVVIGSIPPGFSPLVAAFHFGFVPIVSLIGLLHGGVGSREQGVFLAHVFLPADVEVGILVGSG